MHECRKPVLHLERSAKLWSTFNPENESFTKEFFVASIDMLWEEHLDASPVTKTNGTMISPVMESPGTRRRAQKNIKMHNHTLQSLDNPAFAALIEYEW